jgi:hypothetical protein
MGFEGANLRGTILGMATEAGKKIVCVVGERPEDTTW